MMQKQRLRSALLAVACAAMMTLSACGAPAAAPVPTPAPAMEKAASGKTDTDVMTKTEVMAGDAMSHTDAMTKTEVMTHEAMAGDAMAMPAWQTLELADVATGKNFKLADYHGKTVYVELMATWCPNCRKQLGFVNAAKKKLEEAGVQVKSRKPGSVSVHVRPAEMREHETILRELL